MAVAFSLVIAHPGTPSCYMVVQTGVCPIPGRSLVAPLVAGMLGVCCVVGAGVAAVLGLSAQLDGQAHGEHPTAVRPAEVPGRAAARPVGG
jgi:hypothetical protein